MISSLKMLTTENAHLSKIMNDTSPNKIRKIILNYVYLIRFIYKMANITNKNDFIESIYILKSNKKKLF
jgi:hypothetical protein